MSSTFSEVTGVERIGENAYRADIDEGWWVVRGPHGGYLAAIILRALTTSLDDQDRPIRSFTTQFAAAPQLAPVTISTSIEKAGRSMTFMAARTEQDGKVIALSLGAFSGAWKGVEYNDLPAPEVPGPDDAFHFPIDREDTPSFLKNFDMRWALGDIPFTGSDKAMVGGWFRLREPELADEHVIACFLDAWAPAVFPIAKQPVLAPTIDLTMHFRQPLPATGAKPDDFYLGRFTTRLSKEGFFEEDGEIWTHDGTAIAQSRQLALALT